MKIGAFLILIRRFVKKLKIETDFMSVDFCKFAC